MNYFSDIVIKFLYQQGIDHVSFNPGASFRGIHDSLVYPGNAEEAPTIVMCCHEEIAISVAHGYFKASNRHMAVFVHANVGLLHASMAIFNAWCDRVPLLVIGGNGPLDASKRRPWIDWIHTSQNIDSVVKDFVKWCDQPNGQWSVIESLYRAVKLMNTEAQAPVYLSIDFEVQEEPLKPDVKLLPKNATQALALPAADTEDIAELAQRLVAARMPVMIVDFSGRNPDTVAPLCALVDALGIPVIDRGNRFNLPNTHELNLSGIKTGLIEAADLVIALEVQDLLGALKSFLKAWRDEGKQTTDNTYIVSIGSNDLLTSKWAADYQQFVCIDKSLVSDSAKTLKKLLSAVRNEPDFNSSSAKSARAARAERIRAVHRAARAKWKRQAADAKTRDIITVAAVVDEIHDALRGEEWILTNTGSPTIDGWVKKCWNIERYGSYLGLNGGGGLGYGLGASIGAALAHKDNDNLAVDLQADGDFLYTPSALWTLSAYEVPLLVIVMNNRLYLNSRQHAVRIASNRSRNTELAHIATSFFDNPVDFVGLAKSFNIHALPRVETLADVAPTVRAAVGYIKVECKPALIEIIME